MKQGSLQEVHVLAVPAGQCLVGMEEGPHQFVVGCSLEFEGQTSVVVEVGCSCHLGCMSTHYCI